MNTLRDAVNSRVSNNAMRLLVSKLNSYLRTEDYWCVHGAVCMQVYRSMSFHYEGVLESIIKHAVLKRIDN
jgi:hypothetical protein